MNNATPLVDKTTDEVLSEIVEEAAPSPKKKHRLRDAFKSVAGFVKHDKGIQPAAIITGLLLGTTALATPLLGTMAGAGLLFAGGLGLLVKTSNIVVDNASAFGEKAKVPSMALGIGLGALTSLPELFVSGAAVLAGNPSIAIGNITGSNIANILLILGGTAAIRKINTKGASWKFNAAAMCGSTAFFGAQMAFGLLNPAFGAAMLGGWVSISGSPTKTRRRTRPCLRQRQRKSLRLQRPRKTQIKKIRRLKILKQPLRPQ